MRIVWAPSALADLAEAADYIAAENPVAARRMAQRVRDKVGRLRRFPRSGRVVPERGDETVREIIEGQYRIIYRVANKLVRVVAAARILLPFAVVRLSAGRTELTEEAQALCFLAGANSIFVGDRLLTTPNPEPDGDAALLAKLGLQPIAH